MCVYYSPKYVYCTAFIFIYEQSTTVWLSDIHKFYTNTNNHCQKFEYHLLTVVIFLLTVNTAITIAIAIHIATTITTTATTTDHLLLACHIIWIHLLKKKRIPSSV